MGAVTGVIGSLQALEVIKILSGKGQVMARQMLVFDGLENRFLNVRLRGRQRDCAACGDQPTLHAPVDYVQLCGVAQHDQQGIENHRKADVPNDFSVSVEQFAQLMREARGAPLLDVRDSVQFAICSLPGAVNIPLKELPSRLAEVEALLGDGDAPLYVVCRRGVSSTKATLLLRERGVNKGRVLNVQGGLMSWKARVDPEFPMY
jgi:adenylyltransferase/sulfurtransferase